GYLRANRRTTPLKSPAWLCDAVQPLPSTSVSHGSCFPPGMTLQIHGRPVLPDARYAIRSLYGGGVLGRRTLVPISMALFLRERLGPWYDVGTNSLTSEAHGSLSSKPVAVIRSRIVTRATTPPVSVIKVGFAARSIRHAAAWAPSEATNGALSRVARLPVQ